LAVGARKTRMADEPRLAEFVAAKEAELAEMK
jgi:hypothetical protein